MCGRTLARPDICVTLVLLLWGFQMGCATFESWDLTKVWMKVELSTLFFAGKLCPIEEVLNKDPLVCLTGASLPTPVSQPSFRWITCIHAAANPLLKILLNWSFSWISWSVFELENGTHYFGIIKIRGLGSHKNQVAHLFVRTYITTLHYVTQQNIIQIMSLYFSSSFHSSQCCFAGRHSVWGI